MRTATPLVTWSRMSECGPSATSAAISTPRCMGMGCSTSTSGSAAASRSRVMPYSTAYSWIDGK